MADEIVKSIFTQAQTYDDYIENKEVIDPDSVVFIEETKGEKIIAKDKEYDFVPSGGEEGQILTRTNSGLTWKTPPDPDMSQYYTKEEIDNTVENIYTKEEVDNKFEEELDNKFKEELYIDTNGYDYVDMGEAGIWASCNIGANSPEDPGLYFAWGETKGYTSEQIQEKEHSFDQDNYKFGTEDNITKYNSIDGLTTLELEDDAAHINMRGNWRMPTKEEFEKLHKLCDHTASNINGLNVVIYTLLTDRSKQLIFPHTFGYSGNSGSVFGEYGFSFWTSSLDNDKYAYVYRSGIYVEISKRARSEGTTIRPILDTKIPKYLTKTEAEESYAKKEDIKEGLTKEKADSLYAPKYDALCPSVSATWDRTEMTLTITSGFNASGQGPNPVNYQQSDFIRVNLNIKGKPGKFYVYCTNALYSYDDDSTECDWMGILFYGEKMYRIHIAGTDYYTERARIYEIESAPEELTEEDIDDLFPKDIIDGYYAIYDLNNLFKDSADLQPMDSDNVIFIIKTIDNITYIQFPHNTPRYSDGGEYDIHYYYLDVNNSIKACSGKYYWGKGIADNICTTALTILEKKGYDTSNISLDKSDVYIDSIADLSNLCSVDELIQIK